MGGVYLCERGGRRDEYGENITPNGIVLSADEKTLYVTNGATMAAFDVQPDGSLTNQREFAKLTAGGGDGSTIDAAGPRVRHDPGGRRSAGPDGKNLGVIPTPRGVITGAFGGKDKKTSISWRAAPPTPTAPRCRTPRRCGRSRCRRRDTGTERNVLKQLRPVGGGWRIAAAVCCALPRLTCPLLRLTCLGSVFSQ